MAVNSGGRVTYKANTRIRILTSDGRVSEDIYEIESVRSDRKGQVDIRNTSTMNPVRIQYRRILPLASVGKAVVIESSSKFRTVCPKCNYVEQIFSYDSLLNCPEHGQFELYWLGDKPMTNVTNETSEVTGPTITQKRSDKMEKPTKQPVSVDLNVIAASPECELWTRNTTFDHPNMNVQSHTLLFIGSVPRKYCFNTYNGTMGKDATELPIKEFLADEPVKGSKKERPWYAVKDLDKARAKLMKDGYEKH